MPIVKHRLLDPSFFLPDFCPELFLPSLPQVLYNKTMFGLTSRKRVGVLRGGPSSEYEVSLQTGGSVLKHLVDIHHPHDILITRDGQWHYDGVEKSPDQILRHVSIVFNGLHGEFGEDGKVQRILDMHNVPYTGSTSLASALAVNKQFVKKLAQKHGIKTPLYVVVRGNENIAERADHLYNTFPHPCIVKPVSAGSSVGVTKVHTRQDMEQALRKALAYHEAALVEEYITGREATCGVIDRYRDHQVYSLPPLEIIPPKEVRFFDYDSKYNGKTTEICPGNFGREESQLIQEISQKMHTLLGLRHYSRSDFIVSPRRGIYFLETNSLPGLTPESLMPKSLAAVGCAFPEFLHHVIGLALERK